MSITSLVAVSVACVVFLGKRLLRYLRYFQQEDYRERRFLQWLIVNRGYDKRGTSVALIAAASSFVFPHQKAQIGIVIFVCLGLICIAFLEEDPRKSGKIRLKMTDRAKRVFVCSGVILTLIIAGAAGVRSMKPGAPWLGWLSLAAVIQITPLSLVLANLLLAGGEARRQRSFREDAQRRLREVSPFVIGITGSYGKTSTKAILGEMLQGLGATLWPPGSINTPMGITRYVRENLRQGHRYAVFEMGAYGEGSIRTLCEFVRPSAGIITTIGVMHLERFGSEEAVFRAKSELAQCIPDDGILVLNGDDKNCRRVATLYPREVTLFFGFDDASHLDCTIKNISISPEGTSFTLYHQGTGYSVRTGLLGQPALYNIMAAFTLAIALGADKEYLLAKIRNLKPQPNRLELSRDGDITFINDAYNSNPVGFRAALDILAAMPAQRRILVTPGMVELGPLQESENYAVALEAGKICDVVFIVGEANRDSLITGLQGMGKPIINIFAERNSALDELKKIILPGDVVLIENDLPDLYERPGF